MLNLLTSKKDNDVNYKGLAKLEAGKTELPPLKLSMFSRGLKIGEFLSAGAYT